jgi:hypothetical protein
MLSNANPNPDPNSGDEEDALDERFIERLLSLDPDKDMVGPPSLPYDPNIDLDDIVFDDDEEI